MPPQQHPTARDYQALQAILTSALSPPSCAAAASTWSCGASVVQLHAGAATPATAVSSRKRPHNACAASAASNLLSCWSEADTAVESKRLRLQLEEQEVDGGASAAAGLLAASQSQETA